MKFNVFNAQIGIKLDGLESRNTSLLAHGVGAHLDKEPLMSFISAGPADRLENLKPKRVTLNDTEILLIRDGENVYAGSADCPHKGAPLEDGAVCRGKLVCPWHKGTFDIASADVCEPPALTGLSRYAVEIRDGEVLVDPEQATDSTDKRQNRLTAVNAHSHIVIVGAGAAGAAALQSLVNNRYHGRITVVDPEADAPYDRTLLTKAVTAGDMEPDEVDPLVNQDDMDITEVTRLVAKVSGIDTAAHQIELYDGQSLTYDRLLIATGGIPIRPDLPGVNLLGIHTLRNIEHVERLLADVENTNNITIVGNSFISLEVAASLKQRSDNIRVKVIAPDAVPFEKQFGTQIGQYFRDLHEKHDVEFVEGTVSGFHGTEKVTAVKLESGETLETNLVLLATGITTDKDLLNSFTLTHQGLVKVNEFLEAAEDVYVVGDITSYPYNDEEMHIEHWRLAQQHGRCAAENILASLAYPAERKAFDRIPYFWTQQFDVKFEYVGHAKEWDEIEAVGTPEVEQYLAVFRKDGKEIAALAKGYPQLMAKMIIEMDDHVALSSVKAELEAA